MTTRSLVLIVVTIVLCVLMIIIITKMKGMALR